MNRLNANIKYYSAIRNVRQCELEGAVGCSHGTFWRRMKEGTFTVRDLTAIAKELHITVKELVEGVK